MSHVTDIIILGCQLDEGCVDSFGAWLAGIKFGPESLSQLEQMTNWQRGDKWAQFTAWTVSYNHFPLDWDLMKAQFSALDWDYHAMLIVQDEHDERWDKIFAVEGK